MATSTSWHCMPCDTHAGNLSMLYAIVYTTMAVPSFNSDSPCVHSNHKLCPRQRHKATCKVQSEGNVVLSSNPSQHILNTLKKVMWFLA
eukprot:1076952-Amphidinium_carterae.1